MYLSIEKKRIAYSLLRNEKKTNFLHSAPEFQVKDKLLYAILGQVFQTRSLYKPYKSS